MAFASDGSGCGGCACSLSKKTLVVLVGCGLGIMPDINPCYWSRPRASPGGPRWELEFGFLIGEGAGLESY